MSSIKPPRKAQTKPSSTPMTMVATMARVKTRSTLAPAITSSGITLVSTIAAMSAPRAAKGSVKSGTPPMATCRATAVTADPARAIGASV
jgi:hypothetical protein